METLYFTATAVILYVVADWLLQTAETRAGRRFQNRSLIFFALLLALALVTFALIRNLLG